MTIQRLATKVNTFCQGFLNPYINFHRPCFFPDTVTSDNGGTSTRYLLKDMSAPDEKLKSLPHAAQCLKPGVTVAKLDALASRHERQTRPAPSHCKPSGPGATRFRSSADVPRQPTRSRIPRAPAGRAPGRGRRRAGTGLSRRIHIWASAGQRGRATQRRGMHRARVSSARRRAHRAAPGDRRALEAFLGAVTEAGDGAGLPQFVERELREFLLCGVYEAGVARFQCEGCARERISCRFRARGAASVRAAGAGG